MSAVFCFDLDGTLISPNGTIHPNDIQILRDFRDALFIPASGRVIGSIRRLFQRSGLAPGGRLPYPAITQNGTVTYLPCEKLYTVLPFDAGTQAELLRLVEETRVSTLFSDADDLYLLWPTEFTLQEAVRFDLPARPFQSAQRNQAFVKMMLLSDQLDLIDRVERQARPLGVESAYSMPTICELTPPGSNKAAGLYSLLPGLNILPGTPLYAVGDGGNDLALFDAVDQAFAIAGSPAPVLERAQHVIDPNPEGVLTPMLRTAGLL